MPTAPKKKQKSLTRVLSIDGGGIMGILPGQVLVRLEAELQRASGDPHARIASYFDLVAGTSTGGILCCVFLTPDLDDPPRPRFTAQETVDLYLERGDEIFDVPLGHKIRTAGGLRDEKYPARALEEALEDYLGDLRLSDLLKPCLITSYDIRRRRAHFFTQHDAATQKGSDFFVRDVARATSAAPTFFETARIKSLTQVPYPLIDGGVFVNNPALCAYAEVREGYAKARGLDPAPTAKDMLILSLGTGKSFNSYTYSEAKDWGMVEWIRPLIDIMMSGVAETVDYQLRQIYDAVGAPEHYLRIDPDVDPRHVSPDMDNATPENLIALRDLGQETAERNAEALARFADRLVAAGRTEAQVELDRGTASRSRGPKVVRTAAAARKQGGGPAKTRRR